MRADLAIQAVHVADMRVDVHIRDQVLPIDYPARPGAAPTPLEALLASLAACAGNSLYAVLKGRMKANVETLRVDARAERRKEHPTSLSAIELTYRLRETRWIPAMVERALDIAENQLCPVLAMLRPGAQITSSFQIDP